MPYFKVKIEGVSDMTGKTIVHSDVYQSKDASALAELIRQELDLDRDKNPNSVYIEFLRDDEPDANDAFEGLNVGCDLAVCLGSKGHHGDRFFEDEAIYQFHPPFA